MSRRCDSSKPTPTPLNGLAMKPGKTRRKVIEGNTDTIGNPPSKTSRVPPAWRGGRDEKGAMIRQTTVKNLGYHQKQGQVNNHNGNPGNPYTSGHHGVPPSPASSAPAAAHGIRLVAAHNPSGNPNARQPGTLVFFFSSPAVNAICEVTGPRHRVSPCRSAYYASPWCYSLSGTQT